MNWFTDLFKKENPAQAIIAREEGSSVSSTIKVNYLTAFDKLESINRGVNMIVSACASLDYDIKDKKHDGLRPGFRAKQLDKLLNYSPNPYQSIQDYRTNLFTDFILEGNAFIFCDQDIFTYHLPARNMQIDPDPKTFISGFTYNGGEKTFRPDEVVYFKDLSSHSIYRGTSRLQAALKNIGIMYSMQDFQNNFFDNGAISGLILVTENTLSQVAKDKTVNNWLAKYSHKNGAKKPIIIDSGLKPFPLQQSSFQEMDFDKSIATINVRLLETLGVPPVLLDGGNQANIAPNLRLFYLETVMPIVRRYVSAMEQLTGYDIEAVTANVSALQPDLKDIAMYNTTLVNGGVMKPAEARENLRLVKITDDPEVDKIRIPANIAGSAVDPSQGGAPKKPATPPASAG